MAWSSIGAEQHRSNEGAPWVSSCMRLCRGVSDSLVFQFIFSLLNRDLNGQNPVVTPATKNHLHEFETQSRKSKSSFKLNF